MGVQVEKGEAHATNLIPTGVRYEDQQRSAIPIRFRRSVACRAGCSSTAAAFASDAITVGDRLTVNAGLRFDHSRAISQDLHALDAEGRETDQIVKGLGTLYTWNSGRHGSASPPS